MPDRTSYALHGGIATITMDDGRVNTLSPAMLAELMGAFDRAEGDGAIVVLTGRASTFSAGFDLRVPPEAWPEMITAGARLAERIMSFPHPVIAACNGNAIAMGALGPDDALRAGFLDEVVQPEELGDAARRAGESLIAINADAHAATKLRVRAEALAGIRDGIERIGRGDP